MSLHDYERIKNRLKSIADPIGFMTNLFAHSPVAFAVWSADGHALLTNQAFIDIFASEPPPEYNVLKDDIAAANGMLVLFERAFAGETVQVPTFWYGPRELKSVTVNEGRRVAISMTIFPLFKESGQIEYVAATYKDQTETMLANEQLRLSEERSRLAQQAAHVGTFEWNVQTGINTWTPELEALYGLQAGDFRNTQQNWEKLVYPDDRAAAVAHVNEALETFLPVEGEWRVEWPDGSVHWLMGRFQALKDDAGKAHRLIGANVDITERRQAAEAALLRRAKEAAEEANAELEAFSYSVAHDLRAPLRIMSGFSTVLLEDYGDKLDADAKQHLSRIVAGAQRMGELIDALLSLARLTRTEARRARVDLSEMARAVMSQLRSQQPTRVVNFVAADGAVVWGDPRLLRILLENLLGNAWKFTGKQSSARIDFGYEETEDGSTYHVRDNGAGFDMTFVDDLFAPFRRLHASSDFEGTGIGLATVQRIVRRHGGRVWAEAAENEGATFRFTLPWSTARRAAV